MKNHKRLFIKLMALTGAAVIPTKWATPVIKSTVLPAHAQTSTSPSTAAATGVVDDPTSPETSAQSGVKSHVESFPSREAIVEYS